MKVKEIRELTTEEINKKLVEAKEELRRKHFGPTVCYIELAVFCFGYSETAKTPQEFLFYIVATC